MGTAFAASMCVNLAHLIPLRRRRVAVLRTGYALRESEGVWEEAMWRPEDDGGAADGEEEEGGEQKEEEGPQSAGGGGSRGYPGGRKKGGKKGACQAAGAIAAYGGGGGGGGTPDGGGARKAGGAWKSVFAQSLAADAAAAAVSSPAGSAGSAAGLTPDAPGTAVMVFNYYPGYLPQGCHVDADGFACVLEASGAGAGRRSDEAMTMTVRQAQKLVKRLRPHCCGFTFSFPGPGRPAGHETVSAHFKSMKIGDPTLVKAEPGW
jgi:hypothetical protein